MDLNTLRADFVTARDWLVQFDEWSAQDAEDIGAEIRAALVAQDDGYLAFWADWMARYAEMARDHTAYQAHLDAWAREEVRREKAE